VNLSKKMKGSITIGCPSGPEGRNISIEIRDEASGTEFLSCEMSMEEFCRAAVAHEAYVPITFELRPECVGYKFEHKTELVLFDMYEHGHVSDPDTKPRSKVAAAALKPFEVDGWIAHDRDLYNGHNSLRAEEKGDNRRFQRVHFNRYVHPKTGEPLKLR
jgi:hypothetical protein